MLTLERLLIAYTVFLFKLFEITPEQIERSRVGQSGVSALRPEGSQGLHI